MRVYSDQLYTKKNRQPERNGQTPKNIQSSKTESQRNNTEHTNN